MRTPLWVLGATPLLAIATTFAQSINVNFAPPLTGGPAIRYPAAGLAGRWNVIEGVNGVEYFSLRKLDNAVTQTRVRNIGGTQTLTTNHPGTTGDDQTLLDTYLITYNPDLEVCLFFNALEDGRYEIITYAWLPDQPAVDSYVTVDFSGDPPSLVGGTWSGAHEEGVTFGVHQVDVSGGYLYSHSGITPASGFPSAALNGVQLRKLNLVTPQDVDGDQDVDQSDYNAYPDCHEGPGSIGWRPHCPAFDLDSDADVDLKDFAQFQRTFSDDA